MNFGLRGKIRVKMRNHWQRPLSVILPIFAIALVLQACSFSLLDLNGDENSPESNIIFTIAAQTSTAASEALNRELTRIALGVTNTPTLVGTSDPNQTITLGTATPAPTSEQPAPTSDAACDKGAFVEDITIPDGTTFEPGESFIKTWRIRNEGVCTWSSGYSVVFDDGNAMGGPASFQLTNGSVPPGETIDVSVTLTAPETPGTYRGDWKLRNPAGQSFGLGSSGQSSFWVIIGVGGQPDFSFEFDNIHQCEGVAHAIFRLQNTGTIPIESAEISLYNVTRDAQLFGPVANNGPFMTAAYQCPPGASTIETEKQGFMGASIGQPKPSGEEIRVTIKVCPADGMQGNCTEKALRFVVP